MQNYQHLPLFQIPLDLLQPILNKVTPLTLCRLRQTGTFVDNFVNKHRHRLNCRAYGKDWILFLEITKKDNPAIQLTIMEGQSFGDDHLNVLSVRASNKWTRSFGRIENAWDQIAGIYFNVILVKQARPDLFDFSQPVFPSNLEQQKVVLENNVLPLLSKLRLTCDSLAISYTFSPAEIISPFRFSRLSVLERHEFTGDFQMWPIKNCAEININHLEKLPERLSPAVQMYTKVHLCSYSGYVDTVGKIKQFLKEIARDRRARGCLKHFSIMFNDFSDKFNFRLKDFPGLAIVWKGTSYNPENRFSIENETTAIYKLEIADGFVLIMESPYTYKLHIMPADTTRESIFDFLVSTLFPKIPIDASSLFADFMEADSDDLAFDSFDRATFFYYENYDEENENEEAQSSEDDDDDDESEDDEELEDEEDEENDDEAQSTEDELEN